MGALTAIAIGAVVAQGATGVIAANKAKKRALSRKEIAKGAYDDLMENRQPVINPFDNVSDLTGLASNLTGQMSNPFANLSVATQAAEFQAEEADLALASALDTLRATGAGSGGATALAQAALRSKKGISADLQKQEAQNEQLRAQGEQHLQQRKVQEEQRMQGIAITEGQRIQNADAQGRAYEFEAQETRDNTELSRLYADTVSAQAAADQARADSAGAIANTFGGIANIGMGALSGGADMSFTTPGTTTSDRRLKKNIKLVGKSPSGFKIYAFEYIDKLFGDGVYQGVMSDEIPQYAVETHSDGYDRVDYSKLDVEFKRI